MARVTKTSGALRCAKAYLWDGEGELWQHWDKDAYICAALARAYVAGDITKKALVNTRGVIMDRLAPSTMVSEWLDKNVGVKDVDKALKHYSIFSKHNEPSDFWMHQLQTYRHRWVDALIKEFEAKGD